MGRLLCPILLALAAALPPPADAVESPPSEYAVKAVFIYNLAKFVDWPSTGSNQVKLCVLGADPFGPALAALDNRPLGVRRFSSARIELASDAELKGCDILFVARSEQERLNSLLRTLRPMPILTVGDSEGFAAKGGMVNLYLDQGRVRFEVNPRAARQAGLRLSAKLMQLGRIVGEEE